MQRLVIQHYKFMPKIIMLCINYSERDFPKKSIKKKKLSKTDETKTLHVQIPETSIFVP
jgi:hypothetical protein